MTQFLQNFTNNFLALGMGLFALVLGFFALVYLNKRRKMLHTERMASLIKGLHYAGVAQDIFGKKTDSRDHLLRALRWGLGALGLAASLVGYTTMQPGSTVFNAVRNSLPAIVPAAIGLAHFIFYRLSGKKKTTANLAGALRPGLYRPSYRPAQRA